MKASRNFKDVISLMERGGESYRTASPLGPCRNTHSPFSGSAVLVKQYLLDGGREGRSLFVAFFPHGWCGGVVIVYLTSLSHGSHYWQGQGLCLGEVSAGTISISSILTHASLYF